MPEFYIWCYSAASPKVSLPGVSALELESMAMPKAYCACSHNIPSASCLNGVFFLQISAYLSPDCSCVKLLCLLFVCGLAEVPHCNQTYLWRQYSEMLCFIIILFNLAAFGHDGNSFFIEMQLLWYPWHHSGQTGAQDSGIILPGFISTSVFFSHKNPG